MKIGRIIQCKEMPIWIRYERDNVIGRLQDEQRPFDVTRVLNVTRPTISCLGCRFQATGTLGDRPRSGRPRVPKIDLLSPTLEELLHTRFFHSTGRH